MSQNQQDATMTMVDAAKHVLDQLERPLGVRELWLEIEQRGLHQTRGKTPWQTLGTSLRRHSFGYTIQGARDEKLFYQTDEGSFGLLRWLSEEDRKRLERATYLLAWNPAKWEWTDLDEAIADVRATGGWETDWSCGNTRSIAVGSRFFLVRLGREPRGLVGSGIILTEPREAEHWDGEQKERGSTALNVRVRFEQLARAPYIRRSELDAEPFAAGHWDIQGSGVRVPDDVAARVHALWEERTSTYEEGAIHLSDAVVERWRNLWHDAQQDAVWIERHRLRDEKRRVILPDMGELVAGFLAGDISVQEFRDTYHRRTSNEWDLFGLKGLSGAMFLNKLVKHLPDESELTSQLQACLRSPQDEASARGQLDGLQQYLEEQIEAGVATTLGLQPNRAPFFVSSCWHVQDLEEWPIIYQSGRKALQAEGLLGKGLKGADGYLEFRRVFRTLAAELNLSSWDLEHLCSRIHARSKTEPEDGPTTGVDDDPDAERERVWLIAPGRGASEWDAFYNEGIVGIGWNYLGDLSQYADEAAIRAAIKEHEGTESNPIMKARACHQFASEMQVGDVVFAKRGRREIVDYGVITSEYRHEPDRDTFTQVRSVDWKKRGKWVPREKPLVMKTLTEIGKYPGLVADIRKALGIEAEAEPVEPDEVPQRPAYEMADALREVFLSEERIQEVLDLLRYKKNLVLQGPPGVGKTFFAKRLAFLLLGEKDPDRVTQVQFHQSYSYEDFIQGYRPGPNGKFERVDGPFLRFCDQVLQDPSAPYVLVIDEINRGNLSKIFGELLLLIEADKRSQVWATSLTYALEDDKPFHVPPNLHVIGTMNTADRSLALVDYALRRRFAFVSIDPAFDHDGFAKQLASIGVVADLRGRITARLSGLNERIKADPNLGDGFCVGHSYFCRTAEDVEPDGAWYERIVRTEIAPLLREYWFDSRDRADEEIAQLLDDD